jgi:uncharacterized protein YceH (UPF0502 family)
MDLDPTEIRVLGCLLEKQRTTPDAYPLSLNALRLACNQATNRDPVVDYDDATVRAALHQLGRRRWTRLASGAGSRAAKYRHLLDDALPLDRGEHAVICVLMLRGPQTPGELKQRTERMHVFGDLASLRVTLDRLIARGLVRRLDRRPGHKEERYMQLLGDPDAGPVPATAPGREAESAVGPRLGGDGTASGRAFAGDESGGPAAGGLESRAGGQILGDPGEAKPPTAGDVDADVVAELVERVARLERQVADLREALGDV